MIPRLAPHVALHWQPARGEWLLTRPESVVVLNGTAADILTLCDGVRDVGAIVRALRDSYDDVDPADVEALLTDLAGQRLVVLT
ncbi:pyrroloquinoline quinone biosynthesis peptide chaperone PqqD [Longispora sp. NPDC051575]|uniref:pyrroloquinoline quinone biosynthesis peptide chaperone PqqD n=1 Tax=Longispora sp. NPDC051575 TaxID=3154943 RepID=UPI003434A67F